MKKIFYFLLGSIFLIIIFMPTEQAKATGSFQLINFNDTTTAMEDFPFSTSINFLYSGDSVPEVQMVTDNLPDGAKISSVVHEGKALYSFTLSGVVKKPGEYSLTLILTDNYGAILTQPYILKVVGLNIDILTDSLPRGDLHKPYSATIIFDFIGLIDFPTVTGLPAEMTSEFNFKKNSTIGYHSGRGQITLTGTVSSSIRHYDIKIFIPMNGYPQYNKSRTYSLDINGPSVSFPSNYSQPSQSTDTQETTVKGVEFNLEEQIKNFITEEKEKITTIDDKLCKRLKGRILLQVEDHGEAWYVNPKTSKRHYMANGNEAYNIMRHLGIGITNKDLERVKADKTFAKKHIGKIFLQIEAHGEAYYIDVDGNAHYLKDGNAAYIIMRNLSLGITNNDLRKIDVGEID